MFSRFQKPRVATPAPVAEQYGVFDRFTKRLIASGTYDECKAFQNSFGECYLEPIGAAQ